LPAQSAYCKLHDISPRTSDVWERNARDIFQSLCPAGRLMRGVLIEAGHPNELIVYRLDDNGEVCINGKMVESGLAKSTIVWPEAM